MSPLAIHALIGISGGTVQKITACLCKVTTMWAAYGDGRAKAAWGSTQYRTAVSCSSSCWLQHPHAEEGSIVEHMVCWGFYFLTNCRDTYG